MIGQIVNMPSRRKLKSKPMEEWQTKIMITVAFGQMEKTGLFSKVIQSSEELDELVAKEFEDKNIGDMMFLPQIIQKRIDVMKLPVRFTYGALLTTVALTDRPGAAVILLIDCLGAFGPNKPTDPPVTITYDNLIELYPFGFYDFDNPAFINWVDTEVKRGKDNKRIKWAEVYE